jgi:HK97 family phage prohead protease
VLDQEGQRIVGVIVEELLGNKCAVELTLPDVHGVLHRTRSIVVVKQSDFLSLDKSLVVSPDDYRVKEWQAQTNVDLLDGKAPKPVREGGDEKGRIVDYDDVTITGLLSTFTGTTPKDRDGDYVMDGAFDATLADFRKNPVMLIDHRNAVENLAGSFTKIGTNANGLAFEAKISNAPGLRDLRFKVAEGHLRATSMGGIFFYDNDGRGIKEVRLFEGSLVPVPANQDALFSVRALTPTTAAKQFRAFTQGGKALATR